VSTPLYFCYTVINRCILTFLIPGDYGLRTVSEFIALLTIVVIAVVSSILVYVFVGNLFSTSRANVKYLEASVSSIEIIYSGQPIKITTDMGIFTTSYIYKVTVVIHNVGRQKITMLRFQTLSIDPSIKVCTSDSCDVYDPVEFMGGYVRLPDKLDPNQAVQISFTILSKKNLLQLGRSPFVIKVQGSLPDGSTVTTYIGW